MYFVPVACVVLKVSRVPQVSVLHLGFLLPPSLLCLSAFDPILASHSVQMAPHRDPFEWLSTDIFEDFSIDTVYYFMVLLSVGYDERFVLSSPPRRGKCRSCRK